VAPQLLIPSFVKSGRGGLLSKHLAPSRILVRASHQPLVKIVLALAETVVGTGTIRVPLDYYNELANGASSWQVEPSAESSPLVEIASVPSASVKKLAAAAAICPDGIGGEQGRTFQILVLISSSIASAALNERVRAEWVRVLRPPSNREALLKAATPEAAWSVVRRLETEHEPRTRISALR
jgi:hypothetical protein